MGPNLDCFLVLLYVSYAQAKKLREGAGLEGNLWDF